MDNVLTHLALVPRILSEHWGWVSASVACFVWLWYRSATLTLPGRSVRTRKWPYEA